MLYKAKLDFSGVVTMSAGEVKDIPDVNIVSDLLRAGYIEQVEPAEKGKTAKKRTTKKKV